MDWAKN